MKITIATPLYPPEIAEPALYIQELAKQLCTSKQITVVTYARRGEDGVCPEVITVNKHEPLFLRLFRFGITLWKTAAKSDVLFVESAIASAFPAVIVGKLRHIPLVLHVREDEVRLRMKRQGKDRVVGFRLHAMQFLQRQILRWASKLIFPTQAFADRMQAMHGFEKKKLHIIPSPAHTPVLLPFPIEHRPQDIVFVDSPQDEKRVRLVQSVISNVRVQFPEIRLVPLTGMSNAEMWYTRASAGVIVFASPTEEQIEDIVDAFTAGIPVMTMASPAAKEAVKQGVSGLVFEQDTSDLEKAMRSLLADPQLQNKLIQGGKQELARYSWEAHLRELERIFSSVM